MPRSTTDGYLQRPGATRCVKMTSATSPRCCVASSAAITSASSTVDADHSRLVAARSSADASRTAVCRGATERHEISGTPSRNTLSRLRSSSMRASQTRCSSRTDGRCTRPFSRLAYQTRLMPMASASSSWLTGLPTRLGRRNTLPSDAVSTGMPLRASLKSSLSRRRRSSSADGPRCDDCSSGRTRSFADDSTACDAITTVPSESDIVRPLDVARCVTGSRRRVPILLRAKPCHVTPGAVRPLQQFDLSVDNTDDRSFLEGRSPPTVLYSSFRESGVQDW